MKKILCMALILIVSLASTLIAYAAGPLPPTFDAQMPDCYGTLGESEIVLFANAKSSDGGDLTYQWYSTTVNDIATIRAIDDATDSAYTPPQEAGVVYYCCAVWNSSSGVSSSPVYSRLIRVEYAEAASSHTHAFGEWFITTDATCTEPGIKARECDCGHTERAEVPAAGHRWDEGTVTTAATETADGEKRFTCTVCKEVRTEVIKASAPSNGAPDNSTVPDGATTVPDGDPSLTTQPPAASSASKIVMIAAVPVVGIAAAAWFFIRKKVK